MVSWNETGLYIVTHQDYTHVQHKLSTVSDTQVSLNLETRSIAYHLIQTIITERRTFSAFVKMLRDLTSLLDADS